MRRKLLLTNTAVSAAQVGEELWDEGVRGLHLRCFALRKSWYMHYRTKSGVERRPKLEDVDVMTLAQARDVAREMLVAVASGKDPVGDRTTSREAPTVDDLYAEVLKKVWATRKTRAEYERMWKALAPAWFRKLRVQDVDYPCISRLHAGLVKTPYQANRFLAQLSKMFTFCERPLEWRPLNSNPCQGVERFKEKARNKFFKPAQLTVLIEGLDKLAVTNIRAASFLRFMLYTGARPSEVEAIRPEHVNDGVAHLDDGKSGARDIYLSPQAQLVFDAMPHRKGASVFGRFPRAAWRKLRDDGGLTGMWARDMRRTFGTAVLTTRHGAQAGELLGHRSAQTTKIYTKLVDEAARQAAAAGAAQIDAMAAGIFD